jgi:DNA-binding NarL/FixJ family response regulator
MTNRTQALIVAQPGPLREGLQATLAATPQVENVGVADDTLSALSMITHGFPALVVLSADLHDDDSSVGYIELKARWPEMRCIILVNSIAQQQVIRTTGADRVLIKGVRPARLLKAIEGLLRDRPNSLTPPLGAVSRDNPTIET